MILLWRTIKMQFYFCTFLSIILLNSVKLSLPSPSVSNFSKTLSTWCGVRVFDFLIISLEEINPSLFWSKRENAISALFISLTVFGSWIDPLNVKLSIWRLSQQIVTLIFSSPQPRHLKPEAWSPSLCRSPHTPQCPDPRSCQCQIEKIALGCRPQSYWH